MGDVSNLDGQNVDLMDVIEAATELDAVRRQELAAHAARLLAEQEQS